MVLYFLLWWTVRPSQNQNKYKVGYTMSRKIESANFALKLCANLCVKESFWKHDDSIQEQKKSSLDDSFDYFMILFATKWKLPLNVAILAPFSGI